MIFNVCGAIQAKPKGSNGNDRCLKPADTVGTAYQVAVDYGFCYSVGKSSESRATDSDGEKGVQMGLLTYYDSDTDLNRRATGMTDASQVR